MALVGQPAFGAGNTAMAGQAAEGLPCLGADRLQSIGQVVALMNGAAFQQLAVGSNVRCLGRLEAVPGSGARVVCTDGVIIALATDALGDVSMLNGGFVEVHGSKLSDNAVRCLCVLPLGSSDVDADLWNEALKTMHTPALRHLFQPSVN
eukprot:TRINITY_DN103291_c0_g1_i1.p1 TRINITY_DN103291_c0_g1~~TRINITY_DN103291_c0_g1_i1.p1  ORF type:complete len:150 (+),score=26.43 TRINITY_DN103291_c0_g1_i1:63-512(+)